MSRSAGLAAEIRTMDRIERAMALIEDLPEPSQARVRRWVAETYLDSGTAGTVPRAEVDDRPHR